MANQKPKNKSGPEPERVKLNKPWEKAVGDAHIHAGRYDIDIVGRYRHIIFHLVHFHGRLFFKQLGQDAGMVGRQVLNDDIRHV